MVAAVLSPSSRRAWIEILSFVVRSLSFSLSPSSRRAWIEIFDGYMNTLSSIVALLAEGVDRN